MGTSMTTLEQRVAEPVQTCVHCSAGMVRVCQKACLEHVPVLLSPYRGCEFTPPHEVAAAETLGRAVLLLLPEARPVRVGQALQASATHLPVHCRADVCCSLLIQSLSIILSAAQCLPHIPVIPRL